MIDLHTHSLFSDGDLLPSELVRRAKVKGYRALAITDHGDASNLDWIIPRIVQVTRDLSTAWSICVVAGIELTHVPPASIAKLTSEARRLGAELVVVHGETLVEPVAPGTNRAALEAGVDFLAHPGLLTEQEAALAATRDVFLEITTRRGHSLSNGHVLKMARKAGAPLVLNTDSHSPGDLTPREMAIRIAIGAGMADDETETLFANGERLLKKIGRSLPGE
jgi:histidinol phosphatase-like PHP family hydrolase